MAAVILKQEGSKKPGNRGVLKRTRQPDQLNTSMKFQRSLQAQKGNLTGMRLSTKIEINTSLYTRWFVVATDMVSSDPYSSRNPSVSRGGETPLVWPTCLALTLQMVKLLHPERKLLVLSSRGELFTKVLQGLGSGRGCQRRKTDEGSCKY